MHGAKNEDEYVDVTFFKYAFGQHGFIEKELAIAEGNVACTFVAVA